MKKKYIHIVTGLLLAAAGLWSCSSDDTLDVGTDTPAGQTFSISVADGGYSSATGGIHTKAGEQSYQTVFTAGDRIGVFAVKNNQVITQVNNLCLTAADNGGMLEWKDANGNAPLKFEGAAYYAYYPYQSTLTGNVDAAATDAAGFFANVVSNWTPATDQSTYEKYTAQDLMVAKGSISNNNLSFAMVHQMALVVIDLPGTKYSFNNTNPAIDDYMTDPLDTKFDGYSPYRMSDGRYRYLVRPGSTATLTGGYTDASGTVKGWSIAPTISGGNYNTYTIDGGQVSVSAYTLQAGDYMLKDGTLVSKDATLTDTQKANCTGIVFWVGDPTYGSHNNGTAFTDFGDPALAREQFQCTHGLVVALEDAPSSPVWQTTVTDVGNWTDTNTSYGSIATGTGATDALNKLRGYNNTQAIRAYNEQSDDANKVLSVQVIDTWAVSNPAPATSSGWYLPSAKELTLLCGGDVNDIWMNNSGGTGMRDIVNGQLVNLGSLATIILSAHYWSCSEVADDTGSAFDVDFDGGIVNSTNKDISAYYGVRSVLAF